MNMVRVLIQLPRPLEAKLDSERKRGTSAAMKARMWLLAASHDTRAEAEAELQNMRAMRLRPSWRDSP